MTLKNHNILVEAILLIASVNAIVNIALEIKYLVVGPESIFGYDYTVEYKILVIIFWLLWLIGSFALLKVNKISFILLFPASILSITGILLNRHYLFNNTTEVQLYYGASLLVAAIILVYINISAVRNKLSIGALSYIFGIITLIVLSGLFLFIQVRNHP